LGFVPGGKVVNYLIRRISYAVLLTIAISFISFVMIELPPGDFLTLRLTELRNRGDASAETRIEELKARYGLDKPFLWRYGNWVIHFVQGDFGESFEAQRPIRDLLGERVTLTVLLSLATLAFTWMLAIPLGVYSAVKQYSVGDQIISVVSFIGLGMPGFLFALLVLYVAIIIYNQDVIGLFSDQYMIAPWSLARVGDLMKHLWLPALISAVTGTGGLVRIMRGNLLETLGQPFIEAARARGLKNNVVIWKHAVRVAINPLISILGGSLGGVFVGNALVSIVLNLPTIGPLFVNSLRKLDIYLAGTCLVIIAILVQVGNLLADLVLAWADPRIRIQ
jgi:peptide/nickel transport system permease protein